MDLITDVAYDFDQVLLVPQNSTHASRKQVELKREFKYYHADRTDVFCPIIAANMDTTGTIRMGKAMNSRNMKVAYHKHHNLSDSPDFWPLLDLENNFLTVGMKDNVVDKAIDYGLSLPYICIDVANGYTDDFLERCLSIRNKVGKKSVIMAGNVCTPNMAVQLVKFAGVDIVKVGIGSGSVCTTRIQAGVGIPQFTAVKECAQAVHGLFSEPRRIGLVCSDGGCRSPGDIAKAFGAGADFVMIGGMLSGTDECDGDWVYEYKSSLGFWQPTPHKHESLKDHEMRKAFLRFYGMSSYVAQDKYCGREGHRGSEGREVMVPYRGKADDILKEIEAGIRSACAYIGATRIADMSKSAHFRVIAGDTHNTCFTKGD